MSIKNLQPLNPAASQKLTSWKNEPSLQTLKDDLEAAKPSQSTQVGRINRWNDLLLIRNAAKPAKVKGRSSVQPKLIRRQAEWRYSALTEPFLGANKLFTIKPSTFEDDPAARQNELVLNWQFNTKFNKVKFIDDYVRANVDEGTCIVRTGWVRRTKMSKQKVPIWDHFAIASQEEMQMLQQFIELKMANPHQYDDTASEEIKAAVEYYEESGEPTTAVKNGEKEVEVELLIENRPTAEILNPANVYIDPSCNGDMDKALFVVVSFETNLADLKKEGKRYKNLDRVNWEGSSPLMEPDHVTGTPQEYNFKDKMRKRVVAHEYWGFYDVNDDDSLAPFVATWIGDTLIRMEMNPFPDEKLPFIVVPYLPVKRELYGEPDAEMLEDNQAILGAVNRGMIDLLGRSANSQQGFAKGMLDPLNRRRYDNGQDYEFNPNVTPDRGLIEHKYPEIPQSAMLMLNLQNAEAEALSGVKSFAGGMSGDAYGKNVAMGAVRGVLDAASKREMAILRRLAKGMVEIGQKFVAMNSEFLSEKEVIRVTNSEFITIKREDLKGNFDLEMDISTAEVDNAQAQDLGFMIQTMGPNMEPETSMMILSEIARLKRLVVLADKLKKWQPKPNPLMEEKLQLENEMIKADIDKKKAEAESLRASAKLDSTKADKTNLDFVEQETGTAHEREMAKQGAQARGNQDLQVTKALTTPVKDGHRAPDVEAAVGFNHLTDIARNGHSVASPAQSAVASPPIQPELGGMPMQQGLPPLPQAPMQDPMQQGEMQQPPYPQ